MEKILMVVGFIALIIMFIVLFRQYDERERLKILKVSKISNELRRNISEREFANSLITPTELKVIDSRGRDLTKFTHSQSKIIQDFFRQYNDFKSNSTNKDVDVPLLISNHVGETIRFSVNKQADIPNILNAIFNLNKSLTSYKRTAESFNKK